MKSLRTDLYFPLIAVCPPDHLYLLCVISDQGRLPRARFTSVLCFQLG
ncbi:MAG: hypothetical protein CMIDDMOC_00536 [Sodalis sp. Fle]|nr:MAG: hypothetical protein CMIDDMOC_00536 [Sodalis sp. Fle]